MSTVLTGTTVLITGATGFIGRHLVNKLRDEHVEIRALVRDISKIGLLWPNNAITGIACDLSQAENLGDACDGVDTIFHLASHGDTPDATKALREPKDVALDRQDLHYKTTVEGTRILLDAAVRADAKRLIFFSSVKVLGEGGAACLDENSVAQPLTRYGKAKLAAEKLVLDAGKRHPLHVCVLRLPLVYGADNNGNIPRMIAAIDRGRFPPLPEVGNKRSMVHVADVVRAALLAAEKPEANGQVYVVTDGQAYSTRQLYTMICQALGRPVPAWSIPSSVLGTMAKVGDLIGRLTGRPFLFDSDTLQKLSGSAWYSSEKISRQLGYRPTHTLNDGVAEMVEEYRKKRRIRRE